MTEDFAATVRQHLHPEYNAVPLANAVVAVDQLLARAEKAEADLRTHLETHTLEHWTLALANARGRAIRAERALMAIDHLLPVLHDVHGTLTDWKQGR